ncbi:LysR family transcriptional regulator [Motiliproteus sediminis]|uniref:LysR family transcriptional regulator n=1 Tax=Motiliproteus sediminis TaxID=1468178 RepID=UPI001AF0170F|nr:LysR family transcriptional regulator [Motiliproteus sediminis]
MRYSLRQLEVFLETAHQQNITRAAAALSMSQSAASSALKELEQQFDIQLFDRVGKRLQLNELGRLLQPRAQALMEQARALQRDMDQHADAGALKLGATLTIGNYLMVPMMARYMEMAGAAVTLEVANTRTIVEQVAAFELDLGLIEGELHHKELHSQIWRDDELVVFCAPGHPLASLKALDDDALTSARWILREPGSGTRQTFDRAMRGLLPQLDVALELQHTEAIKRAVEAGLGVGCLSRIALQEAFRHRTLIPLLTPGRDLQRHFYLIHHRHKYRSAGLERWLQLCKEYGRGAQTNPADSC